MLNNVCDLNQTLKEREIVWTSTVEILWRAVAGAPQNLRRERMMQTQDGGTIIFKDSRDGRRYAVSIKEI